MADSIQSLGPYMAVEPEVMKAMLDLAGVGPGDKFIDLGCGDGQFLVEAKLRGAIVSGIEMDAVLVAESITKNLNVTQGDVFDADVSKITAITFWFTDKKLTPLLMDKLYAEMKKGSRLVVLYDSRMQWRDGVFVLEESYGIIPHTWQPTDRREVLGNIFHLYIR